jgi:hypothetical protein
MNLIKFIFLFLAFHNCFAKEFEQISLENYTKEQISTKKMRFVSNQNSNIVIYIQLETRVQNTEWNEKSLKKDIDSMLETRKNLYNVFGYSNIKFQNYSLSKIDEILPLLTIFGSYNLSKNQLVFFSESNIYYEKVFLQIKINNYENPVIQKDVKSILDQINFRQLEINP